MLKLEELNLYGCSHLECELTPAVTQWLMNIRNTYGSQAVNLSDCGRLRLGSLEHLESALVDMQGFDSMEGDLGQFKGLQVTRSGL